MYVTAWCARLGTQPNSDLCHRLLMLPQDFGEGAFGYMVGYGLDVGG
jgi:hypothetical protein